MKQGFFAKLREYQTLSLSTVISIFIIILIGINIVVLWQGSHVRKAFEDKLEPLFSSSELIKSGSQRIDNIVKGLRTFSRLDESERKQVNIIESLQSAIFLVRAGAALNSRDSQRRRDL